MNLLSFFVVLIIIGVTLWAVNTYIPMQKTIRGILNIAAVVITIVWVLSAFGLFGHLGAVRVPQIR